MPPGRLWDLAIGSFLTKIFLASGDELERVSGRSADLIEEADPRTTTELITDNESELALVASGTLQERRDRVVELRTRRQGFRPADLQDALAGALDLDPSNVVILESSRAFAISVSDDTVIYLFQVYRNPALPGTPDIAAAQIQLDDIAHSHTLGRIIESTSLKCDESDSLCDRDLLGV